MLRVYTYYSVCLLVNMFVTGRPAFPFFVQFKFADESGLLCTISIPLLSYTENGEYSLTQQNAILD